MLETEKLDALAERLLGADVVEAMPDTEITAIELAPQPLTLDELARKVLKRTTTRALPEIDLEIEEADMQCRTEQFQFQARISGVRFKIAMVLAILTLVCYGSLWLLTILIK